MEINVVENETIRLSKKYNKKPLLIKGMLVKICKLGYNIKDFENLYKEYLTKNCY